MHPVQIHAWQEHTMPKLLSEGSVTAPSQIMIERGKSFGAWFRQAVARSGKNIKVISDEIGVSRQMLYAFRDDCIGSDHRYRKPSEGMITKIAIGLNANISDGLKCMGYSVENATSVPNSISSLDEDAQYALAMALDKIIESKMVRIKDEYEIYNDLDPEFVTAYHGSTPSGREQALEILQRSRQREREESIGGGVAPSEKLKPDN